MSTLEDARFWPFWVGGVAVAAIAVLYPYVTGRMLGVSGLYENLLQLLRRPSAATSSVKTVQSTEDLERALLAETEAEFGPLPQDEATGEEANRQDELQEGLGELAKAKARSPLFLVGVVLGGLVSQLGKPLPNPLSLGHAFDLRFGSLGAGVLLVLFPAGLLIGFGTRMAGGCTSGHGISGVARAERGSLLSTATFWATGLAIAWGLRWLLG